MKDKLIEYAKSEVLLAVRVEAMPQPRYPAGTYRITGWNDWDQGHDVVIYVPEIGNLDLSQLRKDVDGEIKAYRRDLIDEMLKDGYSKKKAKELMDAFPVRGRLACSRLKDEATTRIAYEKLFDLPMWEIEE